MVDPRRAGSSIGRYQTFRINRMGAGFASGLHWWLLNLCQRLSSASAGKKVSSRGVKNLTRHLSHIPRTGVLPRRLRMVNRRSAIAFYSVSHSPARSKPHQRSMSEIEMLGQLNSTKLANIRIGGRQCRLSATKGSNFSTR